MDGGDDGGATTTTARRWSAQRREGSSIVRIEDEDGGTRRIGKLLGLQGMTYSTTTSTDTEEQQPQPQRTFTKDLFYNAVSSFLAAKHFNERRGDILPHLPELLEKCDFYWSYEYRDSQQQSKEATVQLMEAIDLAYYYNDHQDQYTIIDIDMALPPTPPQSAGTVQPDEITSTRSDDDPSQSLIIQRVAKYLEPFAILGAYWSRVSQTLVTVGGGFEIPYITGGSTSMALDRSPFFARTIPTNNADARAIMHYYRHNLGATHVAILYLKDSWGSSYHLQCQQHANQLNITLASFGYFPNPDSIRKTIENLKNSQYRYIFAIMWPWADIVPVAYEYGVMGNPDYFWLAADLKEWVGDDFVVKDRDSALALDGAGTINLYAERYAPFENAMAQFYHDESLQHEFFNIQADPSLFENFTWPPYDPTHVASTVFDAVIALGLTACNASRLDVDPLFTGKEFHKSLLYTEFQGVSGHVEFDQETGTRVSSDVQYSIEYISLSKKNDNSLQQPPSEYRYESNLVAVVQGDNITTHHPFVYHGNTTTLPQALPPLQHDLNLVPLWAQIVGYCLGGVLVLMSILCFSWTAWKSKTTEVLMASQPFFLCQLCVGTFLMALTVIPISFPGASPIHTMPPLSNNGNPADSDANTNTIRWLDFACMSAAWFHFIGISTVFSALASRIYRVHKIVALGGGLQRAEVKIKDVMAPLYVSMSFYVVMMLCLTLFDPLRYERINNEDYDSFGRPTSSYGTCRPSGKIGGLIMIITVVVTLVLNGVLGYQSYKARAFPEDFSDAKSLSWAVLVLVESLVIAFPFLLILEQQPTARYLLACAAISSTFTAVLMLVFLPKYQMRQRRFNHATLAPAIARARDKSRVSSTRRHLNASAVGSVSKFSMLSSDMNSSDNATTKSGDSGLLALWRINQNSGTFR